MLKKTITGFVLLLALSLLWGAWTPALGDELPPGRWWRLPFFFERLSITDGQKDELDKIFDLNRQKLVEGKKSLEQQLTELTGLLEQERLNEGELKAQVAKVESMRSILSATRFSYSLEVRKLLGHDRYHELKLLYRKWQESGQQP
jgi:Spy/CpxP family protein refolding chaperone